MNAIYIALNTIKINLRDKRTLLMMLLLPIVLILILGNALKNTSDFSVKDIGKITVYYLNNDNGNMSKSFDEFLKDKQIKEILNVKSAKSYDEGKKLVNNGSATAMLYINNSYSSNINGDKKGKIEIYENEKDSLKNGIIKSVIDSYNDGANTVITTSKLTRGRTSYVESHNITEKYINIEGKSPRAIDYYSITMLVMILMYGANYGSSQIQELFYDRIGKRIKCSGTKTSQHIVGVVSGAIFTLLLQALVLILFTKYAYGSNWGSHPFIVMGAMVGIAVLSTSIGILFMCLTGDENKASGLLNFIIPIFTFVSGGYVKLDFTSIPIVNYVPNQLAQSALFNSIYGGSISSAESSILVMIVMSAVLLIISAAAARRKLA